MLTAASHFRRPGTKRRHTVTEQDQTPGIPGDDTKDDDTKGHIVRAGPTTTPRATTPDSRTPSQNQPPRRGNRPCLSTST
jgi:hypothetical protein